jgi:quinol monooxygenase YgiN
MAAGVVHIPWYATLFRGDRFEAALHQIAPVAMRYGATEYTIYRNRDDMYKFMHFVAFEDKTDFEAYWYGPEFVAFRAEFSSYYQIPVLYTWNNVVTSARLEREAAVEGDTV